jgi:hypothetical protein
MVRMHAAHQSGSLGILFSKASACCRKMRIRQESLDCCVDLQTLAVRCIPDRKMRLGHAERSKCLLWVNAAYLVGRESLDCCVLMWVHAVYPVGSCLVAVSTGVACFACTLPTRRERASKQVFAVGTRVNPPSQSSRRRAGANEYLCCV